MDPTLNFQQTVRVQGLQTFALKSCYIFVHFPCCAHRSMMQITMPLRYSQSPCSSTGLGLFDKSPRAASACQDKLKKETGSKQKGLCSLKKAALRGGIHCRMGQISCYVMMWSLHHHCRLMGYCSGISWRLVVLPKLKQHHLLPWGVPRRLSWEPLRMQHRWPLGRVVEAAGRGMDEGYTDTVFPTRSQSLVCSRQGGIQIPSPGSTPPNKWRWKRRWSA